MNTVEDLDIQAVIAASLSEFFERILSMNVEVDEGDLLAVLEGEGFVGVVQLAGELAGRFEIKMGSELAVLMAASMVGGTVEDVDAEHEVPDLLVEMADFLGSKLEESCRSAGLGCEVSKSEIFTKDDLLESSAPLQRGSRWTFRYEDHEGWVDFRLDAGEAQETPASDESQDDGSSSGEDGTSVVSEAGGDGVKSEKEPPVLGSGGEQEAGLELEPLDENATGEDRGDFDELSKDEEDASDLLSDITDSGPETEKAITERASQRQNDLPGQGDKDLAGSAAKVKDPSEEKVVEEDDPHNDQFEGLSDDDGDLSDIPGQTGSSEDSGQVERAQDENDIPRKTVTYSVKPAVGKPQTTGPKPSVKTFQKLDENGGRAEVEGGGFAAGNLQASEDGETSSEESPRKHVRKVRFWMAAAMLFAMAVGGWTFMQHRQSGSTLQPSAAVETESEKPVPIPVTKPGDKDNRKQSLVEAPPTAQGRLSRKLADARNLKETLLGKLEEVLRLQQYLRDGIADVRSQVAAWVQNNGIRAYRKALQDRRIELDLRTIQRRLAAIDQLNKPIDWLVRAAGEIDYGIRKTKIDLAMSPYTAGADLTQLKSALEELTRQYALTDDRLLIDGQSVQARPLAVIWQEMNAPVKKVAWGQGSRGGVKGTFVNWAGSAANRRIWQEICRGDLSHVSDLSMLSSEAAACLASDRVKDLFLNDLKELPAAAARNLARWPGSWLVLNGLVSISPAAARQLAGWQGTCLSLNGLAELSPQAADALSLWRGRQLEMVSLTAKNRKTARSVLTPLKNWETGGRRLLVSPEVRMELDRL